MANYSPFGGLTIAIEYADLHFHPSFFSRGDKGHITEWGTPSLVKIVDRARREGLRILAITSCSSKDHTDKRWNAYYDEIGSVPGAKAFGSMAIKVEGDKPLYIVHGQQIKTNEGDVNILFANERIPVENSGGNFEYVLNAARDLGDNTLITIPHPSRSPALMVKLKESSHSVDAIESFSGLDSARSNARSEAIAEEYGLPGIAVSDGHRLPDMARGYVGFYSGINTKDYDELGKTLKRLVREKNFSNIKTPCSMLSKGLFLARLANAVLCPGI